MESHKSQHYPSPTRHHHHACNPNSSSPFSSFSEKRFIRRAVQGTPYPQTISIPPAFSSSPPRINTANIPTPSGANSIFSPRLLDDRPHNALFPPPTPPASQCGPSVVPRTPTSSLARRRRLSAAGSLGPPSSSNTTPAPAISPYPPPPSSPKPTMAQRHHTTSHSSFRTDPYKTPGQGSIMNAFDFRGHQSRPSTALPEDARSRLHAEPENEDEQISQLLELDLQMMEDEPSDEDIENMSHSRNVQQQDSADDALARIAQAMNLLSLQPPNSSLPTPLGYFSSSPNGISEPEPPWPPHPTPENLLRESLRHSLEAYRTLKMLDNAMVNGSVARESRPSRRQSVRSSESEGGSDAGSASQVHEGHVHGEVSIVEAMKAYDRAAQGIRAAREVLSWAEHWIGEERDRARERLLKG